jgi:hypothetical protein
MMVILSGMTLWSANDRRWLNADVSTLAVNVLAHAYEFESAAGAFS